MKRILVALLVSVMLLLPLGASVASAHAYDMCPNLKGMQKTVPAGYIRLPGLTGPECYPASK